MDFAFVYLLVSFVWWVSVVAFVLAGGFSTFVVWFVARDVWRMLKHKQQR